MSKPFPETAIISITTHGEIRLNRNIAGADEITYDRAGFANVLPTFEINPNIIDFYKFNAVVPGVLSYVGGDDDFGDIADIEKMVKEGSYHDYDALVGEEVGTINTHVRDIMKITPFMERNLNLLAGQVSAAIKDDIKHLLDKIQNQINILIKQEELDEEEADTLEFYKEFVYNFDKASNLINCLSGGNRKMINKTFFLNEDNISPRENWSITLLNEPINERNRIFDEVYNNLRSVLRTSARKRRSITMEQLINYLAENGVKKLFIIDLTCCPILGPYVDDPTVADKIYRGRTGALLRRSILGNKLSFGGRKTRKFGRKRGNRKRRTYKK